MELLVVLESQKYEHWSRADWMDFMNISTQMSMFCIELMVGLMSDLSASSTLKNLLQFVQWLEMAGEFKIGEAESSIKMGL